MKAQISSQIFVYIIAAVIAGVILLVGTKAIVTVIKTFGQVNIDDFKSSLENSVASMARQFGSIKEKELELNSHFDEVCFVDSMIDNKFELGTKNAVPSTYSIIRNSILNDVKKNIFLLREGVIEEDFYVDDLLVEDHFLCMQNTGRISIWLEGKGNKALLYKK